MPSLLSFLLSVTISYSCALAFGSAPRKFPSCFRSGFVVIAVLACPLLIPANEIILRAVAALVSGDLAFKVVDMSRLESTNDVPLRFSEFWRFMIPFPFLLVVFQQKQKRLSHADCRWTNISRAIAAMLICAFSIGFMHVASLLTVVKTSFFCDHVVKVSAFVLLLEALSRFLYRLERLFGYDTVPIVNQIFKARTVAEFWQRYNTRVHSWFYYNVFRRTRFRHSPALSVSLVFLVNGFLHELMFGIATSKFDGYQMTFFLAQIPAVLTSRRLRRFAVRNGATGAALAHVFTISWMLATTMFFFHGVNRIVPIYTAASWLR